MSGRLEFTIPGDSNEMSPNARLHWRTRHRLSKAWREKARIVYRNAGAVAFHGRVQVTFTIRRGRRLDADNARSSGVLKACIDGFVDGGMVPNDSIDFLLCGEVKQETGKRWQDFPELVVTVEECDD